MGVTYGNIVQPIGKYRKTQMQGSPTQNSLDDTMNIIYRHCRRNIGATFWEFYLLEEQKRRMAIGKLPRDRKYGAINILFLLFDWFYYNKVLIFQIALFYLKA